MSLLRIESRMQEWIASALTELTGQPILLFDLIVSFKDIIKVVILVPNIEQGHPFQNTGS